MSVDDVTRINIYQFLSQQQGERYHAFVLHGPPLSGKTTLAKKLVSTTPDAHYFDVLRHTIENPSLTAQIDLFDTDKLRNVIIMHAAQTRAKLLLIDEMDFLVPIWGNDLTEFKQLVRTISVNQSKAVIGFILQTFPPLEEWVLPNSAQQDRVLRIEHIQPL